MRYKLEISWTSRLINALGFRRSRVSTVMRTAG